MGTDDPVIVPIVATSFPTANKKAYRLTINGQPHIATYELHKGTDGLLLSLTHLFETGKKDSEPREIHDAPLRIKVTRTLADELNRDGIPVSVDTS